MFTHYDIADGLIQSQVNKISQDNTHRLWIATLGGVSRFDGVEHFALTKANGLKNNFAYAVFCDSKGRTWIGANKGLACYENGKLINLNYPAGPGRGWINRITEDKDGNIWGITDGHLFKVSGGKMQLANITGGMDTVTTVAVDPKGRVFAAVNNKALYYLEGKAWKHYFTFPSEFGKLYMMKLLFDKRRPRQLWIQGFSGIYITDGKTMQPYAYDALKVIKTSFVSMTKDAADNLWIGTGSGAYRLSPQNKLTAFNAQNGFSDAEVSDIYEDRDGNIWLGTQGDGLYRYNGDHYVLYNRYGNTEMSPIVMGIARDRNNQLLLAIDGDGVGKFDGRTISPIWDERKPGHSPRTLSLLKDDAGLMWVGTNRDGIFRYDGKKFDQVKGTYGMSGLTFARGADGTVWAGTSAGVYYFDKGDAMQFSGVRAFTSSLLALGGDSVLAGSHDGLKLIVNKKEVPGFKLNALDSTSIYSMIRYKGLVLIGSDDSGVFAWNMRTGRVKNYTTKDGLPANSIYSLAEDEHGTLWAGTGRGVSRFSIDPRSFAFAILPGGELKGRIIESNQNGILYHNHQMLVGTTKGLTVFSTDRPKQDISAPYVMIGDIKVFDGDKDEPVTFIADDKVLKLSPSQDRMTISFLGVYLKSPAEVTYQYRLVGLNKDFGAPVKSNAVDYPSLPPGKYTFEVKAMVGKQVSKNIARFSFEIAPPFYQTTWFRLGSVLALILIGVSLQSFIQRGKRKREQAIELMREEEKAKIRQQTAEDFHDDLGNKLTRITVLSDILDAQLGADKTEPRKLVWQIKQNAASLYNGTRDILWAMDPKSDNLYEVLNHIRETGIEIFADTPIDLSFDGIIMEMATVKLPMEYSRNITMIFKELLNNALKHAHPKHVVIELIRYEPNLVTLQISDDGVGFDTNKPSKGHGCVNIRTRAKRIGGDITVASAPGEGTAIALTFNINPKIKA
ncbi:sensor histidine kinase [Mucilaginibacter myungsuensis]|nr:two-component regulator propeller domain-containing protein [Mucilaginibacter myungsuensis]